MPNELPLPVEVRFGSLYRPNESLLTESLVPFGMWSDRHIAAELPVKITYPLEISERLKVLKGYMDSNVWPAGSPIFASEAVQETIEKVMPRAEAEIAHGVRTMAAAAIRDDGSRAVIPRNEVLMSFLAAKMLAIARSLCGSQFAVEARLQWGDEFSKIPPASSNEIIHGISFLEREPHGWAGWTEADMHIDYERYRIFIPICPRLDEAVSIDTLAPEQVRRFIVPQLLRLYPRDQPTFSTIRRLISEPWSNLSTGLVLRDEVFVDSETFSRHPEAKAYVVRIAADRIASRLKHLPPNEQPREIFRLTHSILSVSFEVSSLVQERLDAGLQGVGSNQEKGQRDRN
jgi:hypothetical protein